MDDVKKLLQALVQLKLSDKYFKVFDAASEEAIDNLQATISSTFDDGLTIQTIKKTDLGKYPELSEFMTTHCQIRHYMFSVKKCGKTCKFGCKLPQLPMDIFEKISHLPDPVPGINQDHYKSFSESYAKSTTEEHRPSLKEGKKKDHGMPFSNAYNAVDGDVFTRNGG